MTKRFSLFSSSNHIRNKLGQSDHPDYFVFYLELWVYSGYEYAF